MANYYCKECDSLTTMGGVGEPLHPCSGFTDDGEPIYACESYLSDHLPVLSNEALTAENERLIIENDRLKNGNIQLWRRIRELEKQAFDNGRDVGERTAGYGELGY